MAPHISTCPFTLSIYHILDFWCKIRFRKHIIIIQGQTHPLKNFHKKLTVKGGGWGVNPYGQPDRKILIFVMASLNIVIYQLGTYYFIVTLRKHTRPYIKILHL